MFFAILGNPHYHPCVEKNRLEAFSDGVLAFYRPWLAGVIYVVVALMWLVPDKRLERVISEA